MLDPQDHNDFFVDEDSDNEASAGKQENYTSHDLEKELRDILGDEYDDGTNADGDEVNLSFPAIQVNWRHTADRQIFIFRLKQVEANQEKPLLT